MAFPTTISGLQVNAQYFTRPFSSSAGNVYVFGRSSSATDDLAAFKATDPTSSFSGVGSNVEVVAGVAIAAVSAFQVGDIIHVVTGVGVASGYHVYYHVFDMSSDTWTTTKEAVKTGYTLFNASQEGKSVGIVVRSDGDVIVTYNGQTASSQGRVFYARREGGSWTIDVSLDNAAANWLVGGVALGSSDRAHFFFSNFSSDDEYQRTLTSANSLQTLPSSYDTSVNSAGREHDSPVAYVSGGVTKVRYAYHDALTGNISVAKFDSADTPTVTTDVDISGSESVANIYFSSSLSVDGTTLWHTFIRSLDSDIWTQSSEDGAAWSTATEFYDDAAAVTSLRTNVYARGGNYVIGIVYTTASAVLYHEKTLGVADDGEVDGEVAITFAAMTLSSGATAAIVGASAMTLGALTLSSDSDVALVGDASFALGAMTLTATYLATTDAEMDAAFTLGAMTLSAAGTLPVVGAAAQTLGAMTLSATFEANFPERLAASAITLGAMTLSGTIGCLVVCEATIQLAGMTLLASSEEIIEDGIMGIESFVAGYDGALGDQIHSFLLANTTGTTAEWTTSDLWLKFFTELGYVSGSLLDRNRNFLIDYLAVADTGQTLQDLWGLVTDPYTPAP